jgi:hypothetical protein
MELGEEVLEICAMLEASQALVKAKDSELIAIKQEVNQASAKNQRLSQQLADRESYVKELEDSLFELDARIRETEALVQDRDYTIASLSKKNTAAATASNCDAQDDLAAMLQQAQAQMILDKKRIEVLNGENKRLREKLSDQDKMLSEYEDLLHQQQSDIIDMASKLRSRDQHPRDSAAARPSSRDSREPKEYRSAHRQGEGRSSSSSYDGSSSSQQHSSTIYIANEQEDDIGITPSRARDELDFDSDGLDSPSHGKSLPVRINSPSSPAGSATKLSNRWGNHRNRTGISASPAFHRPKEINPRSTPSRSFDKDDDSQAKVPSTPTSSSSMTTAAQTPPDVHAVASRTSSASSTTRRSPVNALGLKSRRSVVPIVAPDTIDFDVS